MLDATNVQRLAQIDTHPHNILSLYLSLDNPREMRGLALGEMLKRKESQLALGGAANQWNSMADDRKRIARYVDELPMHPGRGLALFSCSKANYFEAFSLSTTVPNTLEVGPTPYIRPLAALASDLQHCLSLLLDRKSVRFFDSYMGSTMELDRPGFGPDAPFFERDGGQGRTGDNQVSRWEDQTVTRFFKEVAAEARNIFKTMDFEQMVVGGSRRAVEAFPEMLPNGLGKRLAGTFILDTGSTVSQVSEAVAAVQEQARQTRQAALLQTLSDNMGPGGKAATGLNQVLASLYEGQVHTLFVRRGQQATGGVCPSCGRLRHVAELCPICGEPMIPVTDIINQAIAKALDSGAKLEQVGESGILDEMGGIAALLRYS